MRKVRITGIQRFIFWLMCCYRVGANVDNVSKAIGLDPRIGAQFLQAGLGFGGSCFKKDILSLSYLAETLDLPEVANYWRSVIAMNEWQCGRFVKSGESLLQCSRHKDMFINLDTVIRKLNGSLRSKKVAILGYAFKKDTGDTRESQAAEVVRLLQDEDPLEIAIYDPQCSREVIEGELNQPGVRSVINVCDSPAEACDRASAVLILTDWDQFRYPARDAKGPGVEAQYAMRDRLIPEPQCISNCLQCPISTAAKRSTSAAVDWVHTAAIMSAPKLVFDGRGVVDPVNLQAMGFRVEAIGRASANLM